MDPWFIFVPPDLSFFISFETDDYRKQYDSAKEGIPLSTTCPDKETYKNHQIKANIIGDDAIGRLYKRFMLANPLHNTNYTALSAPFLGTDHPWLRYGMHLLYLRVFQRRLKCS